MYLTNICDIDQSWPEDEDECLEYFHRIRSLKYLRQAYEQLGPEIIEQLNEQFSKHIDNVFKSRIELLNVQQGNMNDVSHLLR